MKISEPKHLTLQRLRERGWTATMVRDLLGEPDEYATNPHYKCAPPCKLYLLRRIKQKERTKKFATMKAKAEGRAASGLLAASTKRKKLMEELAAWQPKIGIPDGDIYVLAIDHYEALWAHRGKYKTVDLHSDNLSEFHQRIVVNYLRHQCTNYDGKLTALTGRVGVDEAKDLVRSRILEAIADQWPELAAECGRQDRPARFDEY